MCTGVVGVAISAKISGFTPSIQPKAAVYFDYSLPSLKPSQNLSFGEERAVENNSRSLALLLQLGRRL